MNDGSSGADPLVQGLIDQVVAARSQGREAVALALEDLVPVLHRGLPIREAHRLLGALQASRHFEAMSRAADALLDSGIEHRYVKRQYAQALIEQGQFTLALQLLRALVADLPASERVEKSEAFGLLGRLHKQRFVQATGDRERAARELNAAIGYYASGYEFNNEWHGANLVALVRRAERENIPLPNHESSRVIAQRLLRDLERKQEWAAWTHASAGEAYLALEDWESAKGSYACYLRDPSISGFAIAGAVRQLREIWQFAPHESEPSGAILAALQTRVLSTASGGEISSSPQELAQLSAALRTAQDTPGEGALEAILGENALTTLGTQRSALRVAALIGNVADRRVRALGRASGGTGFLVDGGAIHERWRGRPLILTNHHVLSHDGESPSVRVDQADVTFSFWEQREQPRTFAIEEILATSNRANCDCTLASLRDEPAATDLLRLNLDSRALGPRGAVRPPRVYLVGYPGGRGLEFSMSDNHVVDHELGEQHLPLGHARIHYNAPTEKGMSGSPVFDPLDFSVIGLHRASSSKPLRVIPDPDKYRANEAVWMQSVVESLVRDLVSRT